MRRLHLKLFYLRTRYKREPQGVTAKTLGGYSVDSYGMAVPGAALEEFLGKCLPGYQPENATTGTPQAWKDVAEKVKASVLMIVKTRN